MRKVTIASVTGLQSFASRQDRLPHPRKDGERGFALLLVFLMAAAVALVLYQQMPRVAFESEREKEQLLQDRGHEYVRAIQLYYIAFKKYPTKIEDLENTNNKRFLRRRYIDPMTGKEEWRLIHVNAAGQLTDSVVQKPPASPTANGQDPNNPSAPPGNGTGTGTANGSTNNTGITQGMNSGTNTGTNTGINTGTNTGANTGSNTGTNTGTGADGSVPDVNAAVLRRPSDRTLVPPGGITPPGVDPNDPRYWPPATTWTPPNQNANGQPGAGQSQGQQFGGQQIQGQQNSGQQYQSQNGAQQYPPQQIPGQQFPGQTGALPGGFQPGLPGQLPFQPGANQFQQGTNQFPNGVNQFQSGANQFQTGNNQSNNPNQVFGAQNGVQGGVLPGGGVYQSPQGNPQNGAFGSTGGPGGTTSSGPGSNNALGMIQNLLTTPQQPQTGNMTGIGSGGLAGVASTYKAPSIKIYKDRQKYNEWEFIFDLKSAMPGQGQQGTLPGLGQGGPVAPGQNGQPGQNGINSNNGPNSNSNSGSIFGPGGLTSPTSGTSPPTTIPH
jgi:hypothetical protein